MKHILPLMIFALLLPAAFAYSTKAECYAAAQERYEGWEAEAEAMAASNSYTLTGTCPVNSGRMEPCTGDYPGVNYCACQYFRCDASGGGASCISQLQQCCLANAKYDNAKELARLKAECDAMFRDEAPETDKCSGVTCSGICVNGQIYRRECKSGSCVVDEYASPTRCPYGCKTGSSVCSPQQTDYCADFYSRFDEESCYGGTHYYDCKCDPSNGEPRCKLEECPNGCDSQGVRCKAANKCVNVECTGECISGTYYYDGTCDEQTGECEYSKSITCPNGCDPAANYCKGGISGRVYFIDHPFGRAQGIETPVRWAQISITTTAGYVNISTDEDGRFSYDAFAPGAKVTDIYLSFAEKNGKFSLPQSIQSSLDRRVLLFSGSADATDPSLMNMEFQLSDLNGTPWGDYGLENAVVYSNILKAIEFNENVLGRHSALTEKVYTNEPEITSHCSHSYQSCSGQYRIPPGIIINSADMNPYLAQAPLNREFHEYCHHIQDEFFENHNFPPGNDHGGYSNPTSQFGLIEGWAEFCALEMKKHYGLGPRHIYEVDETTWNMELNYKMDTPEMPMLSEEIAIAGILLDLRDSPSDYGGVDDDFVSMPLLDIYSILSTKRDFKDGKGPRYIETVRDLYVALDSSITNRAIMRDIDQVFILHGAFQDSNSNGRYDSGETIGYSGKGGVLRSDLAYEPGTEVIVDARDPNGNPIREGVVAVVSVDFSGNNSYLSYTFEKSVVDGKIAVPIPPKEYDATITIRAKQAGGTQISSKSTKVTTAQIYENIDPSKPLGTYSPVIDVQEVSCESSSQCIMWGYGDTCSRGKCTTSGNGPGSAGDSLCAGLILLLSAPFLVMLAGRMAS
ncbi:MAG: hypothetical protein N3H30_01070 [Candidatus Micrarchaeota archaeon]|nr:hypothetical protein [Candidatus Micrarchaeota archaeon]